jgi:hypothetical protein
MEEEVGTAESYFQRISINMKVVLGDDSSVYENNLVAGTIELIERCASCVEKEFLISKNEQLDDIPTSTLKVFTKY